MQNRRLSSRFLLCLVAMALFAGIGIELAPYIAFADLLPPMADDEEEVTWIDGAGVSRTDTINKWTGTAIARNLVIEDQIEVCTSDYPIALNEAVGDLNGDLGNVFAVGACQPDLTNDYIDFVEIDGRLPSADDFFCGGSPFACILLPPRSAAIRMRPQIGLRFQGPHKLRRSRSSTPTRRGGGECLSSTDPGILVAVDNDCVTIRASRMLIDWHGEGHDEICGIWMWDGTHWHRYAIVNEVLIPGSEDYTIFGGAVLWLIDCVSARADGTWPSPPVPTAEELKRLARLAAK